MKKLTVFVAFILVLFTSCTNKNISKEDNAFIITPQNKYYIDYQNVYLELTPDTYITRDKQLKDYLTDSFLFIKNPFANSNLINDLNKYFPYELKGVTNREYDGESREMPLLIVNNKKIIDTVSLTKIIESINQNLLIKVRNDSDIVGNKKTEANVDLSGRSIHILNANGINGAAKKMGDRLAERLGITYNAENNSTRERYSYIATSELNEDEVRAIANATGILNVKISNRKLPEGYSATLIYGSNNTKYTVDIVSPQANSELKVLLNKDYNARNIRGTQYKGIKTDEHIATIFYNPEDYLIAQKISSKVPRSKLTVDESLRNKIVITANR